jgi:hypothetical protein
MDALAPIDRNSILRFITDGSCTDPFPPADRYQGLSDEAVSIAF